MAKAELNPLEMSDDDINDAIAREFAKDLEPTEEVVEEEETSESTEDTDEEPEEDNEPSEEPSEEVLDQEVGQSIPDGEEVLEDDSEASEDKEESTEVDDSATIDYKSKYDALLAPFKANGREMKVDSVEDARTLMQMGANYNKKMAALKPNLKLMKMLENNDLLNSDRLSYLIDLDKKNPDAIKKLLKDSGIDPLDIDNSDESNYKPSTYNVSDSEIALDSVLGEIKDTASFSRTMDIVGNKWDSTSQDLLVKQPEMIRVINEQVESGFYDQVMSVVERERVLGRLNGLSDIQAYYQIGQMITANEGQVQQPTQSVSTSQPNNVNRAANTVDPKLKSRKKAASSTKSAPRATQNEDFNPLSMSDDDFDKLVASKFV